MKLTIVRGLPGSGKSTFAKTLGCLHLEADMYFVQQGVYRYDASKIKDAHAWCQKMANVAMYEGMDLVVSNTFSQKWEAQPYLDAAFFYGYDVEVIAMEHEFTSIHDVPQEAIERMRDRWEEWEA